MELRHLRYFIAVAEELNFSRAARRLGISQPPLSKQIRQLERELGVPLFERQATGVTITEAGAVVWEAARQIVEDADALHRLARQLSAGNFGMVRVGTVGSALMGELPELIRMARDAMPDVAIEVEEIQTGDQGTAFLNHRIDIGIFRPPVTVPGLRSVTLSREQLVAVLPAGHPASASGEVDAQELRDDTFVLFPRRLGVGLWDSVMACCQESGFRPHTVVETPNIQAMVGLVAAGLGVSLLPESVRHFQLPNVRYVPLRNAPISALELGWIEGRTPAAVRRFVELARSLRAAR
jgi:DNA-binding transcriptional LysR family regulator